MNQKRSGDIFNLSDSSATFGMAKLLVTNIFRATKIVWLERSPILQESLAISFKILEANQISSNTSVNIRYKTSDHTYVFDPVLSIFRK